MRLPAAIRRDIAQPVTDLAPVAGRGAPPIDRNRAARAPCRRARRDARRYASEGFAPFAAEWQHRHAYQGKPVKLLLPDGAA